MKVSEATEELAKHGQDEALSLAFLTSEDMETALDSLAEAGGPDPRARLRASASLAGQDRVQMMSELADLMQEAADWKYVELLKDAIDSYCRTYSPCQFAVSE